jgi:pyruvate kinase
MLQSMIETPIPTRAEAADVSNAVFDQTDCVMLSGETASGNHPLKAVRYMKKLVAYNETKKDDSLYIPKNADQTHAVVRAALSMTKLDSGVKIDKVLVFTQSGYTAKVFSSFRPDIPIIALSESEKTVEQLTMSFGIVPYLGKFPDASFTYDKLFAELKRKGHLKAKDLVVVVHGKRWQDEGRTNAIVVLTA